MEGIVELIFKLVNSTVVLVLVIFSYQIYFAFSHRRFKWIIFGWAFNLLYVIISIYLTVGQIGEAPLNSCNEGANSQFIESLADLLAIYFFATFIFRVWSSNPKKLLFIKSFHAVFLSIVVLEFFRLKYLCQDVFLNGLAHAPRIALTATIYFVLSGILSRHFQGKLEKKLVKYAFMAYGLTQVCALFMSGDTEYKDLTDLMGNIGFAIGLISKLAILLSLHLYTVYENQARTAKIKDLSIQRVLKETEEQRLKELRQNEERRLKELRETEERRLAEKQQLLSMALHEISPPILVLRQIAEENIESHKRSNNEVSKSTYRVVKRVEEQVLRSLAIINASREFLLDDDYVTDSEIKYPFEDEVEFDVHSLNTLVESAILSVKKMRDIGSIKLQVQYTKDCDIYCKPNEVVRIVINVISNSVDAIERTEYLTQEKPCINIKTTKLKDQKSVLLIVDNNAISIPEEEKDIIFKRGFSSKREKGHGLGLYIVKDLLKKNKGKIEMISPFMGKDYGVTTNILFPLYED